MPLGVLEDNKLHHVPGTVLLDGNAAEVDIATANLKHATGKNVNIILAPQPSEDPNDPLNWSLARRDCVLSILLYGAVMNAAVQVNPIFEVTAKVPQGGLLNAGNVTIAEEFGVTVTKVALISGYNLLVVGATG